MNRLRTIPTLGSTKRSLMTGLTLVMAVLLFPRCALASDGAWIPVGFDDPRGYAVNGFLWSLKNDNLKAAFRSVQPGSGTFRAFSEMVTTDPTLTDIRSFELLRVTAGGGQSSLEARIKGAGDRSPTVTFRLKQSRGSDEGWLISSIVTDNSSFPHGNPRANR